METPVILYRKGMNFDQDHAELCAICDSGLKLISGRVHVQKGDLVIGRYSVLPFYKELESEVLHREGRLINSYRQHQFIADMREWTEVLGNLTPRLYERLQDLPEHGPFVLKGQTNSKKHLWDTHMFANTRREAMEVYLRLADDSLLSTQEIYARDYVPLKRLMTAFNGLPITKEFRFFVLDGKVLCGGFYWASHVDDLDVIPDISEVPADFLQKAIDKIGDNARFYALDVAQKENGGWMVVEINDGQQSGLSCVDPLEFYTSLAKAFTSDPR